MRILFVSPHYPPEPASDAQRVKQLARAWVCAGHEVHVVCGPAELQHQRQGPAARRAYQHELRDGVQVHRLPLDLRPTRPLRNGLRHGAFALGLFTTALTRVRRPDVAVVSVPPVTEIAATAALSRCLRMPLVVDLARAPCSEAGSPLRNLDCNARWRLVTAICRLAIRTAAASPSFVQPLYQHGLADERVDIMPDGADVDFWSPGPADERVRARLGARPGQTLILYAGTLAPCHDVSTLVKAANRLAGHSELCWAIVGSGPAKAALIRELQHLAVDVKVHEPVARDELREVYRAADLVAVTQQSDPFLERCVPAKLYEVLACGRPVVAAVGSAGAAVVRASAAGVAVQQGDDKRLARSILRLAEDARLRDRMARSGPPFIRNNYAWNGIAERYAGLLEDAITARRSSPEPGEDPLVALLNRAVAIDMQVRARAAARLASR